MFKLFERCGASKTKVEKTTSNETPDQIDLLQEKLSAGSAVLNEAAFTRLQRLDAAPAKQ